MKKERDFETPIFKNNGDFNEEILKVIEKWKKKQGEE